jgi:hypothetical protein
LIAVCRFLLRFEKEADHWEDHAVDAIVTAAFALRAVEVAIMEALRVRKIAIVLALLRWTG